MEISESRVKEVALAVGAFAASYLLKRILEEGYERVYHEEPPNAIKDEEINWGKLLGWAIISGVSAASLKILIKRYGAKKIRGIG